jgi:uncharacterized OB-fold protein
MVPRTARIKGEFHVSEPMLSEPWRFYFPYTRTTGPTVGRFLCGLQDQKILGIRRTDGSVMVPPHPFDPITSETLTEMVEVGTEGVVTSWTWIAEPLAKHPLDRPFAFALIKLDGAETGFFHAVDAVDEAKMSTGMRVKVRWAPQLKGHISDIACFVPTDAAEAEYEPVRVEPDKPRPPERWRYDAPFETHYEILAGKSMSTYIRGLKEKKLIGMRGPSGNVYIPPHGADATTGLALQEPVELGQNGTVVRYCIVNIPIRGQQIEIPFAAANILVDGADNTLMALVQGIPHEEVRLGLRVKCVWVDDDELGLSESNIKWFVPNGEDDQPLSEIEEYL